jgi:hypothetical protein
MNYSKSSSRNSISDGSNRSKSSNSGNFSDNGSRVGDVVEIVQVVGAAVSK